MIRWKNHALNSVLVDVLDYYSILKNNAEELKKLRKATELSSNIIKSFYNANKLQNNPNSFQVPIEKLFIRSINKKS